MSGSPLVDVSFRDHVALLQLNNAARRNVLDVATSTAMQEAVERLGRDPQVRCVVIAGSGGIFASGADIRELATASAEENLAYNRRLRDAVNAVAAGDLTVTVGGGYACGAFALVELFDYINGHPPKDREVLIPLVAVTKDNATKYQDQVLNGMDTYDFKAVSQVYTPTASTDDYGITLK